MNGEDSLRGNRPYSPERFRALLAYIGRHPLRGGLIAVAVIVWHTDFGAYAKFGRSVTGATYIKAATPGELPRPKERLWRAALRGWRYGALEHRIRAGRMTYGDVAWLERQWNGRVPV